MARQRKTGGDAATVDVDSAEVDRAARALPGAMESAVSDAMRRLGDRFVADTRRKVKAGPGRAGGPTDNRGRVARGIGFVVRGGDRLELTSEPNMPAEHRAFPAAYSLARWSHPIFGGRGRGGGPRFQVSQRGTGGYWRPRSYQSEAERLFTAAGQDACDKVSK